MVGGKRRGGEAKGGAGELAGVGKNGKEGGKRGNEVGFGDKGTGGVRAGGLRGGLGGVGEIGGEVT